MKRIVHIFLLLYAKMTEVPVMKISAQEIFDGFAFRGGGVLHLDARIKGVESDEARGAGLVMPGMIDSHAHLLGVGLSLLSLRLNNCRCRGDFALALKAHAEQYPEGWITGGGWDQNKLGFTPDRRFLDHICPDRPVLLSRICGHVAVANSRALALAGIDGGIEVPGGAIVRDNLGEPTGILEEKAIALVGDIVPPPEPAILYTALEKAIKYAHSCGITGVHTDDRGELAEYADLWELYTKVTESHPIRVQLHYHIHSPQALKEFIGIKGELPCTDLVTSGAAKLFLDGSLGARTAALLEDYSDDPGNKGILIYPDAVLGEILSLAEENGIQMAMHVIGDAALDQALRVLRHVRGGLRPGRIRHRLVHCQVTRKTQWQQIVALGMMAEIQPGFLPTDMQWAEKRLGRERLQTSYCWRSMAEAGIFLTGGSDAPVEDLNPWLGIAAAVTRRDRDGVLAPGWQRDEYLGLEEALSLYTSAPAELAGWQTGRLIPGCAGDVAVYAEFDREDLAGNKPEKTIINGTIVYQG
jgi:predicted amidohydrolase YtcJ